MYGKKDIEFNSTQASSGQACIKVIGVGGGGCNAVNRMIVEGISGVEFWVVNTDAQVLAESKAKNRIILGKELTKGLGAGANPNTGREASIESEEEIREALKGADMIFIAAGMGGGTGTGSAPVIAKIAKDLGALTMAIVTRPFTFEGTTRMANANQGLQELKENVDSLIVVSNDKLLEAIGNIPLKSAFQEADKVLRQGVQTITDLIAIPSLINLDFADVRTIMQDKGYALIGIGMEKGENKAEGAALKAISSPLLEASITGAKDAIVNVTGSESMTLFEANAAVEVIREHAGSDINIIFGVAINEELDDQMIVTVIATGFDEEAIIYADPNAIAQRRTEWKKNLKASVSDKFRTEQELLASMKYQSNTRSGNTASSKIEGAPHLSIASRSSASQLSRTMKQNVSNIRMEKVSSTQNISMNEEDDIPAFLRKR